MIPILYESTENSFTTNGLGRLADAIECTVTEERNGGYELYMQYPVKGVHFGDISLDRFIYATHDDTKVPQAFRIYKISKPLNGVVSVYAEHISYELNKTIVMPFSAASCAGALVGIEQNVAGAFNYTLWTDKSVVASFKVTAPQSVRATLGGQSDSILDTFGAGEFEWDMRTVKLYTSRGTDAGVVLRYGKNITDITADTDMTNTYTAIVPYWTNGEEMVTLPEKILYAETQYSVTMAKSVDLSNEFEDKPSVSALRAKAQEYLTSNQGWIIKQNVKVDFVQLWQTEEYADYAPLQRVRLCDTVTVVYEPLNVETTAKVVKTVYNTLLDRYDQIEIGEASETISDAVKDVTNEATKGLPTKNFLQESIERATELITGGLGGYVQFVYNADGEPEELVILDEPNIEDAVNVWRWNKNGLGFSSTGYDGEYRLAMTYDGHIVADFVDTGFLSANRIRAGILTALSGKTQIDVDAGIETIWKIQFLSSNGTLGGHYPLTIASGKIQFNGWNTSTGEYNDTMSIEDGLVKLFNDSAFNISFYPRDGGGGDARWASIGMVPSQLTLNGNVTVRLNQSGNQVFRVLNEDNGAGFFFDTSDDSLNIVDENNNSYKGKSGTYWTMNSSGQPAALIFLNGYLIGDSGF